MRTRSQSRNLHHQQQQAPPAFVEPFNLEQQAPPLAPMDDTRTMAQLLQAPTEGYEDAIVIPEINANFELKHARCFFTMPLKTNDQIIEFVAGGNFLDKMPRECLRIIQGQSKGQGLQNQIANLTDMLSKFVNANTAFVLWVGTLPSNTVTNPKEDLKGHTKDTMPPVITKAPEDVPTPVFVPVVHHESISEPVNALVSASMPNQKASIPFPSRRNDDDVLKKLSTQN
ncbi:hypothetical protein Tco_1200509 [Tanacetum coccineum]